MGYLFPFPRSVRRSQDFGANPGWGPNPPGGHNGDDWAVPVGTPVRAPGDGVVVFAGEFDDTYADNWGWNLMYGGKMVILNMDGDFEPYFEFGHNSELRVKTGDRVRRGQVFALSGNSDGGTGVSTGPHSHVGCLPHNFNLNTNTYGRVNPRIYMTDYWEDEAGSASLGPAGDIITETTDPQEDEVSEAVDRIIAEIRNIAAPGESGKRTAGPLYDLVQNVESINSALLPGEAGVRHAGAVYAALAGLDPVKIAAAVSAALPAEVAKQVGAALGGK